MIPTDFHHTIYELEGDIQDLAAIKNSELLDKKVVKRSSEATLVIEKDMSIQEELVEYLAYILELEEDKIQNIVGTFNDYAQKAKQWDNCFSYGSGNVLDLEENTVTQIIGTNGMGKSSIPLIIEEALI